MQLVNKCSKGDTIVEVLFAISIFSLVAVGGLSIMNKGNAVAQRALEITLVRQQIDAQAEILRFSNASYVAAYKFGMPLAGYAGAAGIWANMIKEMTNSNIGATSVSDFGADSTGCPALKDKSFVFDTESTDLAKLSNSNFSSQPDSFSQIRFDNSGVFERSDGLWIEAVRSSAGVDGELGTGYIDFHIRACWSSIGQVEPMTIGTIVRLYEPR